MIPEVVKRKWFEAKVNLLVGRRIQTVEYWDVNSSGFQPAPWDCGAWHHAVMGIQIVTDAGPFTVTCTNTLYPYGVEVFNEPIERHLVLGDFGPRRNGPDGQSRWAPFMDTPLLNVATWWDRLELGSGIASSGKVVEPGRSVDLPTAIRLDVEAGSVWLAAAIPMEPSMEEVFVPGDEIMVIFEAEKIRAMGYDDADFVRSS